MDDEPFIIAAMIAEDEKRRLEKKSTEEIISVDHWKYSPVSKVLVNRYTKIFTVIRMSEHQ